MNNRIQARIIATIVLTLCWFTNNVVFAQTQAESKMLNTKHNLGIGGSGTIRATAETDICVFCHTPHVPKQYAASQLWNHRMSTADYTLYSSEYLTSLSYASPSQPNSRSKLCLSCHDGTVAIGAVYNLGGSSRTIAMQNNVTTIPSDAAGNIGTSLKNDHPVGFIYDNTKDLELTSRSWPWNTQVKLDPDAANGTVECITCHEPHDNSNGKFLRVNNVNAYLCTFCHSKTGWSGSVHQTSMQSYSTSDSTATTIGEWSCRTCHQSHNGKGVPYLLKEQEENTCFASGCHGSTLTGPNTKNIQSQYNKLYSHPTVSVVEKHRNPDDATSLDNPNRHAECQDCHNSHQAQKGLHSVGSNLVSSVLKGVSGVLPGFATEWKQPTTFSVLKPVAQENQICFKCHSAYAFGDVPDGITTITGPSGNFITDQAMEFNAANHSAHPVQVPSNSQTGSLLPKGLLVDQMIAEWNDVGRQTMYCSDCHGNDQSISSATPQGPHGSDSKFMLTGRAKYWPTRAFGDSLWSLADLKYGRNNWQNDLFCSNCHTLFDGAGFKNNVHASGEHENAKCVTCHLTVPHGSKRSRLIGYETDLPPYNYNGTLSPYDKLMVRGFERSPDPFQYSRNNCSTSCHIAPTVGVYEP